MFKRHWRARAGTAVIALVMLAASACSSSKSGSSSSSATPGLSTVTIGIGPFLDNQTLSLAQDLGFAAQQGIKFDFKTLPSNNAIFQEIEADRLDLGAGTLRG